MRTYERSTQAITLDADGIAAAQQLAGAGNLTLNGVGASGGVAVLSPPRRVSMFSAGDVATVIFTLTGLDRAGSPITDTVTGINNTTVSTNKIFERVTQIAASAAVGSDVIAGWTAECVSPWLFLGTSKQEYSVGYELDVTGTVAVDVERTFRNILRERITGEFMSGITDFLTNKSADEAGALTPIPVAIRLVQNSGSGSCVLRVVPTVSL